MPITISKPRYCGNCGLALSASQTTKTCPRCKEEEWKKCGLPVVERAKEEVLEDIREGRVPATVRSFAELHDYVDANNYGGAFEGEFDGSEETVNFWNRVQSEVDAWLKNGRA